MTSTATGARPRDWLELVRVFLTPTAPADSLTGLALVVTSQPAPRVLLPAGLLVFISICLYSFGMVSNDLLDRAKDRESQSHKPIPSGRVSVRAATLLTMALAALAILGAAALALAVGPGPVLVTLAILALALAYNSGGKRIPILGNLLMGGCRAGNLLLGVSATLPDLDWLSDPRVLGPAGILGLFVAGITAVSVLEDRPPKPWLLHALATPILVLPAALGLADPGSLAGWLNTVALFWLLLKTQRRATSGRVPGHPAAVYVRGALGGLFLLNAGLLWAFAPDARVWPWAVGLYLLGLFAAVFKRAWLRRGGPDT